MEKDIKPQNKDIPNTKGKKLKMNGNPTAQRPPENNVLAIIAGEKLPRYRGSDFQMFLGKVT